ncbi:MAG: hypothetical protein AAF671_13965 [Pseudomonadota bacterium]
MKENLSRYVLEATLIVFSVLLALFLDNVWQERKEAHLERELVSHIADEMSSNLAIAEEWLPYHREVIKEIDRYLSSDELMQSLLTPEGIDYGQLMKKGLIQDFYSDASWQLAQQSAVSSRIEFDVSYAISQAYLSQRNVNLTLVRFSDFFFERETLESDQLVGSLKILRGLLRELAGQQDVLQYQYRKALEAVGETTTSVSQ